MTKGTVFNIQRYSVHDGPGIRTTVFLKGCPLNCWWCHNPESQSRKPELVLREARCIRCEECIRVCERQAISWQDGTISTDRAKCDDCGSCVAVCAAQAREMAGRELTVAEVVAEIERDISFYDESIGGVTFSGGEPLLQSRFLLELLRACKEREIHTAVDTSGYASTRVVESMSPYVDLFLYDLKLMDEVEHKKYTGVSNRLILRNLQRVSQQGHGLIVRIPIIPGITDRMENIGRIAGFAASLPHLAHIEILPYHDIANSKYPRLNRVYQIPNTRPPSAEDLARIAATLRSSGLRVSIGG